MRLVGKNAVVYGGGVSGRSAYELLRDKGARAIVYDDDMTKPFTTNSIGVFEDADIIVLSPGVSNDKDFLYDAKLSNKLVIGELELASRLCDATQIAITGTNGKTTTTMLINHILNRAGLRAHAVGNIGAPFSGVADRLDVTEYAVIEASSFQLESVIDFSPDIAVLLNITQDHISRHKTFEKYVRAKANVFMHQSEEDYIVYNDDDDTIKTLIPQMVAKKVAFSTSHPTNGAYVSSGFVCYKGVPILAIEDIDFRGAELENVLASVAVCAIEGVSKYCIATALMDFSKPSFRRERVGIIDGVYIYNDSKSTNVSSCICAINSVGECVLIIGGQDKGEDFEVLFKDLPSNVKHVIATGENAQKIIKSAKDNAYKYIHNANDLKEALFLAYDLAKRGGIDTILFSPASKSFDSFKSFEDRGRFFNRCVTELRISK